MTENTDDKSLPAEYVFAIRSADQFTSDEGTVVELQFKPSGGVVALLKRKVVGRMIVPTTPQDISHAKAQLWKAHKDALAAKELYGVSKDLSHVTEILAEQTEHEPSRSKDVPQTQIYIGIDVETGGLDPQSSALLEVAVIPLDAELKELDDGYRAVIAYAPEQVEEMKAAADQIVLQMHEKTGLWEQLSGPEAKSLQDVDDELLAYIQRFAPETRTAEFLGNSLRLDMNFADKYLPKTAAHMHYRSMDVSNLMSAMERWAGLERPSRDNDPTEHTAMGDIRKSVEMIGKIKGLITQAFTQA